MSYSFMLFKLRRPALETKDFDTDNWLKMGSVSELRCRIDELCPGVTWQSRGGLLEGTLRLGEIWWRFILDASMPFVTADTSFGTPATDKLSFIQGLCDQTGWTALDNQRGAPQVITAPQPLRR